MSLKKETPSDQLLHLASLQGNLEQLRKVLDSGRVHVDCKDKEGTTPLILASANNHLDCVKELLKQGADPGARRLTGTCALFFAAQGGYLDIVKELLENGAPVDLPSYDGGTPLFVACQCNHLDVAEELIARGADIQAEMIDGATSLFIAAQNGHLKMVKFLLSKGAKANARRKDGASALWIACQMGHVTVVKELIDAGAEVDCVREVWPEELSLNTFFLLKVPYAIRIVINGLLMLGGLLGIAFSSSFGMALACIVVAGSSAAFGEK
ncbi:ankyrin repeat domain-containing protein 29-like [Lingula anatina]|uniref:Ankyrin repeat domain-containing protein 29-like n=1 Tax=Lingula anatina TaxID=7574 RepID=A0A1S3IYN0_LINAN|nr:ankyrin repeat domain-containing protein 29-like [Lingula anatina]|eukprot:XP_013403315.1 ankyrin repeat domain-containing protein 29-like [Lingula anatina]